MREIKFRGKRIDNGEWIIGSLVQAPNDDLNSAYISIDKFASYDERVGYFNDRSMSILSRYFPINPYTICQFTGLYDKKGQEIYEGDIVEYGVDASAVFYEGGACCLKKDVWFSDNEAQHFNVIGNVHDNPELLEVPADD